VTLVTPSFHPTEEGWDLIEKAYNDGATLIIGSIIAAKSYPGKVAAMVATPGYERVPPAEKRASATKFTVFDETAHTV
jgi:hypothetical protein